MRLGLSLGGRLGLGASVFFGGLVFVLLPSTFLVPAEFALMKPQDIGALTSTQAKPWLLVHPVSMEGKNLLANTPCYGRP